MKTSRASEPSDGVEGQDLCEVRTEKAPSVCRVCAGYGWIAQKQFIDDGYGEPEPCPACEEPR